jgi:hypothetical protein
MTPEHKHIAGLELALATWNNELPYAHFPSEMRRLINEAQSAPDPVQGEAVEVAGYRWKTPIPKELQGSEWAWSYGSHWSTGPKDAERLMTVAQHNRLMSAAKPDADHLRESAKMVDAELVELLREVISEVGPLELGTYLFSRIDAKLAELQK